MTTKLAVYVFCSRLTTSVLSTLLSKFTSLQIFQDALLQRQSFVDGGNDGDDRNQGILEDGKEEKLRCEETST